MTRTALGTIAAAVASLLTLSCLGPLFLPGGHWVLPAVIAILLAAVCGALGRALPLSGLTGSLLVAASGLGLVTAVGTPHEAYLGFVPNSKSLSSLDTLISGGFSDIRTYAPPVPASTGLIVLVSAAVFAVAVAVDLFAVGAERPVLAGIPLLALVAVPAAFRPGGLGVLHLLLAFTGWLLLVAVDSRDRLTRWGRPLGRSGGTAAPLLIGGAAGRVAGVGVIVAFVFPALLPDLHGGIIHPPSQCCAGGSATVVPPLVTIDNQLHSRGTEPLLRVTTNSPQYLRFTALDYFDGNSFSLVKSDAAPGKVDGRISAPTPGIGDQVTQALVQSSIQVLPALAERYLPLPYSPVNVKISGTWQLSPTLRTVFSTSDTTSGKTFDVTSEVPTPTRSQLQANPLGYDPAGTPAATASQLAMDLRLPKNLPAVLSTDADQVTRGQKTAFDKLAALEKWFTTQSQGGFQYTLAPSPALRRGPDGIADFLKYKMGFCEQFASVFTLMARHLGLPARVAVGFTPGEPDPTVPGIWNVSTSDAHAWPEVWFTGVGWVRFEPTPRQGLASYNPGYLTTVKPQAPAKTTATPTQAPAQKPIEKPDPTTQKPRSAPASVSPEGGPPVSLVVVLVIILIAVLGALSPALARLGVRRRRLGAARAGAATGAAPADVAAGSHALWSELMDTVRDIGVILPPSETPRATGRRLAGLLVPSRFDGNGRDAFTDTLLALGGVARAPRQASGPPTRATGSGVGVIDRGGSAEPLTETVEFGGGRGPLGSTRAEEDQRRLLDALGRTVSAEEQARYGRPRAFAPAAGAGSTPAAGGAGGSSAEPGGNGARRGGNGAHDAAADARMIRAALISSVSGAARLQARLLPRSVLGRARRRVARGGSVASRAASTLGAPARFVGRGIHRS